MVPAVLRMGVAPLGRRAPLGRVGTPLGAPALAMVAWPHALGVSPGGRLRGLLLGARLGRPIAPLDEDGDVADDAGALLARRRLRMLLLLLLLGLLVVLLLLLLLGMGVILLLVLLFRMGVVWVLLLMVLREVRWLLSAP